MSTYQDFANAAANIELAKGRSRANAAARSGEIWGQTIAQLGQVIPQQVQEALKVRAQEREQAQIQSIFQKHTTEQGINWDGVIPEVTAINPTLGMDLGKRWNDAQKTAFEFKTKKWEFENAERDALISLVSSAKDQASYTQALVTAGLMFGREAVQQFPQEYNPQLVESLNRSLMTAKERADLDKPPEPKYFTLTPGMKVFGEGGNLVAENPYVMTPDQVADNERMTAIQQETARHNRAMETRPVPGLAPIVIQGDAGPMVLNRGTNTATPVKDQAGNVVGPAPTAQQRNTAQQYAKAKPILDAISALSEKINTGQGIVAKAQGAVEIAKAKANLNDDVAEYEALISGFTPLIARALGHVGVLTEQDVQSVKAMFPRPGDSKSLRDRKVAQITRLMGAIEGSIRAEAQTPPGVAPGGLFYQDYLRSKGE